MFLSFLQDMISVTKCGIKELYIAVNDQNISDKLQIVNLIETDFGNKFEIETTKNVLSFQSFGIISYP